MLQHIYKDTGIVWKIKHSIINADILRRNHPHYKGLSKILKLNGIMVGFHLDHFDIIVEHKPVTRNTYTRENDLLA